MKQGSLGTKYRVTICKQEEDSLPIITTYNIGRKTYERILAQILKTQGIKVGEHQR